MSEQRVRVSVADHVATVTLSRPDKHNALDGAMFLGIVAAAEEVAATGGVRAVVLHGEGPSFCSGLDIAALMTPDDNGASPESLAERGDHRANLFQRVATDWLDLPMPVVVAIHGNCFGGGMQIALGGDVRIAAPDARLAIMEAKWGLIPDMGITSTLPGLVRRDVARELTYTARIVSGEEAAQLGLVTRTDGDPLAAAQALAAEIAQRSPDAVRSAKRLYAETALLSAAHALKLETDLQLALMGSPNQIAAVTAGLTKQPGEFSDPAPAGASTVTA